MRRMLLSIGLCVVELLVLVPAASASWTQFRQGPARTGYTATSQITSANAAALQVRWSRNSAFQTNLTSSPSLADHRIFVGGYDVNGIADVFAYTSSGRLAWSHAIGGVVDDSPAVDDGKVFIGSCDDLYAFDIATGAEVWSHTFTVAGAHACDMSSPAVSGGVVYVSTEGSGALQAVDEATGNLLWSTGDFNARSSPAVAGDLVLEGGGDHRLHAFPTTCTTPCHAVWTRDLGNVVEATPAISGGLVYANSWDSPLYALDLATGAVRWTSSGVAGSVSSPAVANGVVYVADGHLTAYDAATGAFMWSSVAEAGGFASPSVTGSVVVVGYRYTLRVFDASTGALLRTIHQGEGAFSSAGIGTRAMYATKEFVNRLYKISLPR